MTDVKEVVETLLEKASKAVDANEALKFSQAALNAAHTKHALADLLKS